MDLAQPQINHGWRLPWASPAGACLIVMLVQLMRRKEFTGRPELIGHIKHRHPSIGPFLCFPGPTGDGVALTRGGHSRLGATSAPESVQPYTPD